MFSFKKLFEEYDTLDIKSESVELDDSKKSRLQKCIIYGQRKKSNLEKDQEIGTSRKVIEKPLVFIQ